MSTNYYGSVILYRGVPFHPDYKDSILFCKYGDSAIGRALQLNWLNSYKVAEFNRLQYTRVNYYKIRLEGNAENYYSVNYCYIENVAHNNNGDPKYFFAFVTQVDYINDNVFEVTFDIDVIQTWQFNFTFRPCFVEREHPDHDDVGDNLISEPVEVGDYIIDAVHPLDVNDEIANLDYVLVTVPLPFEGGGGGDVTVIVGSARSTGWELGDEAPGDQSGNECSTQEFYEWQPEGWDLIRPNDTYKASRIALCMSRICANNWIGYSYNPDAPTLLKALQDLQTFDPDNPDSYNPNLVTTNCQTNCSQAVRICCLFAGIDVGSFYTGNEYDTLIATGEFTGRRDTSYTGSKYNMRVGDILVSKTQGHTGGHTVVVVSVTN